MKSLTSFRSLQSSSGGGNGTGSRPPIPPSLRTENAESEVREFLFFRLYQLLFKLVNFAEIRKLVYILLKYMLLIERRRT